MVHITRICLRKVSAIEDLYSECHIFNGGYYTVFDISWKANCQREIHQAVIVFVSHVVC